MATSKKGPRLIKVDAPAKVYGGQRVENAANHLTGVLNLYDYAKLTLVLEAVYKQGQVDGRREVFDEIDHLKTLRALKHRNPGRPRKI